RRRERPRVHAARGRVDRLRWIDAEVARELRERRLVVDRNSLVAAVYQFQFHFLSPAPEPRGAGGRPDRGRPGFQWTAFCVCSDFTGMARSARLNEVPQSSQVALNSSRATRAITPQPQVNLRRREPDPAPRDFPPLTPTPAEQGRSFNCIGAPFGPK